MRRLPLALALVFLVGRNSQSQSTAADQATNQTTPNAESIAYCDLLAQSERFNGQTIRVQAVYETDFEESVITSPSCPTPLPMIWVTFEGQWESRTKRSVRKAVTKAKWRVPLDVVFVGKFKTDGKYGHMDMYPLSFEVYQVEAARASKGKKKPPKP